MERLKNIARNVMNRAGTGIVGALTLAPLAAFAVTDFDGLFAAITTLFAALLALAVTLTIAVQTGVVGIDLGKKMLRKGVK